MDVYLSGSIYYYYRKQARMKDTAQVLQRLGFGDYEARAYTALLQRSPMTGYEIAKHSRDFGAPAVPEPASLLSLGLGAAVLLRRRKRA